MATEKLNIVIDTVYRGRTDARRARDDMRDMGTESRETADRLVAVSAGLIAAGGAFVGFVGKMAAEGARLDAANTRFENLATSIGTTADLLLDDMRRATRGLVDDATLITGATDLINVGIAGSHEEALRFVDVIGRMGLDMQQLTLTVVNQSKLRLDSLGLSVEDVTDKYEILRQTLPDEEAWKIAVLESLEEKSRLLGDASETTAGKIEILRTKAQNLLQDFQLATADGVTPLIDEILALSEISETADFSGFWNREMRGVSEDTGRTLRAIVLWKDGLIDARTALQGITASTGTLASDSQRELAAEFDATTQAIIDQRLEVENLTDDADDIAAAVAAMTAVTEEAEVVAREFTEAEINAGIAAMDLVVGMESGEVQARRTRREQERLAEIYETQTAAARNAQEQQIRYNQALEAADAATGDLFASQIEFVENADPLAVELYNQADAAGASAEELALLGIATGLFTEEQAEAALKAAALRTKIQELGEKIAEGMGIDEALTELELFKQALDTTIADRAMTITVNYDDRGGALVSNSGGTGPQISENATGTPSFGGGATMVGEFGPELMTLPQGTRITSTNVTHNQTMNLSNPRSVQRVVSSYLRNRSRRSRAV